MTRAVRRFNVSIEFVVEMSLICLRISWLVWVDTSPPIRVVSRTWRATSGPAESGGGAGVSGARAAFDRWAELGWVESEVRVAEGVAGCDIRPRARTWAESNFWLANLLPVSW